MNIYAQENIPHKRAHHALIYDEAGKKIFMTAGSTPLDGGNSFKFFNDCWNFDGTKWMQKGIAGDERSGIALAYDTKRNKIYSFGGFTGNNQSRSELRVFENNDWKFVSEIPGLKAAEAGLVYDSHRDRLITFGGSAERGKLNNETWEWDGKEWKKLSSEGPPKRAMGYLAYDKERKKVVLFGGRLGWPNDANDTWEWDGTKWTELKF